ncbi:MAG: hypothetical protein V5B38_09730 [Candidatus Accumulibacter propinquus]
MGIDRRTAISSSRFWAALCPCLRNKEGQKRLSPDIRIDEIELQGGKKDSEPNQPSNPRNAQGAPKASISDMDDDIPFTPHGAGRAWRVI